MKKEIKYYKNGIISIKHTVQNPARALEYILEGLETQRKRKWFGLKLRADIRHTTMCTIQEIAQKKLTYNLFEYGSCFERAKFLNFNAGELQEFEFIIDFIQDGGVTPLFEFFDVHKSPSYLLYTQHTYNHFRKSLTEQNFRKNLPFFKGLIKNMRTHNHKWN